MPKRKPADHLRSVVKVLISAIPCVGGPIATLISEYVSSATERDTKRALEIFSAKIQEIRERIEVDKIDQDEFSELFKSSYLVMVRTHRDEKLRAAANILANLCLMPNDQYKSSYEELDHLIRCIDALSIGAIEVLGASIRLSRTVPTGPQLKTFRFEQLGSVFPQRDADLVMSLVSELRGFHLIRVQEMPMRSPGYQGTLLEPTATGRRLAERFIEGKM